MERLFSRRPKVAVIGAGVIGLPIAVMLTQNRFKSRVTIIAAEFSPNITSDHAGAMMRLPDHDGASMLILE